MNHQNERTGEADGVHLPSPFGSSCFVHFSYLKAAQVVLEGKTSTHCP